MFNNFNEDIEAAHLFFVFWQILFFIVKVIGLLTYEVHCWNINFWLLIFEVFRICNCSQYKLHAEILSL